MFAAFGLSGAAGLNPWLPLFVSALLARAGRRRPRAIRSTISRARTRLIVLGLLTVADFVGDKVPAVDHVLHAAGAVIAPTSGAILFAGQTGLETDLPTAAAAILGALAAGSVHFERAAVRGGSTVGTGGTANPYRLVQRGRRLGRARGDRLPGPGAGLPRGSSPSSSPACSVILRVRRSLRSRAER